MNLMAQRRDRPARGEASDGLLDTLPEAGDALRSTVSDLISAPQTLDGIWLVTLAALITALATGLGAIPLAVVRDPPRLWLGVANGLAAGLMLAASHGLIAEATNIAPMRALGGVLLGLVAILAADRLIPQGDDLSAAGLQGASARKAVLILGVMIAHSFAEGVGVGVSFAGAGDLAQFVTAAIALHNVPEGLAIALVLVPRGTSPLGAAGWSVVSSLPQPLMAAPAFLFVTAFAPFLPVGLGLAAGAMIWMVFAEITPDAIDDAPPHMAAVAAVLAFTGMIAFQFALPGG
jgi:zinc transporter ZupT